MGFFRMVFGASGNAVPVLQQMNQATRALTLESSNAGAMLKVMSADLDSLGFSAGTNIKALTGLSERMNNLSSSGQISASTLVNLAKGVQRLSDRSQVLAPNLNEVSSSLVTMSSALRETERVASKAGAPQGGFQMMKDVSEGTANRMRMLASASQGAMISMALLQRNITGLAFSLIFLQFSGFLKLSLAIAGVLAVAGGMALGFKALVKEGNRVKDLADQFFILTGSAETAGLANDAARKIAEKYGVSIGSLEKGALGNLLATAKLTNDEFDTFGGLLALADAGVLKNIDSTGELVNKFVSMKDSGKGMDEILLELGLTTETFNERLDRLNKTDLGEANKEMQGLKNSFREVFSGPATAVSGFWREIKGSFILGLTGFFQIFTPNWEEGWKNLFIGIAGVSDKLFTIFNAVGARIIFAMLINPLKSLGGVLKSLGKVLFGDFFSGISEFWEELEGAETWHELGKVLMQGLWDGIKAFPIIGNILTLFEDFVHGIKDFFGISGSPSILMFGIGKDIMQGLWNGIKSLLFLDKAYNLFTDFITVVKDILSSQTLINIGKNIITFLWRGVTSLNLVNKVSRLFNSAKNVLSYIISFEKISEIGTDMIEGLWDGIKSLPLLSKISGLFTGAVDVIKELLDFDAMIDIGNDMLSGLWEGIYRFDIVSKVKGLAGDVISGMKSGFGMWSPSREMMKIGEMAIKGFNIGMGGTSSGHGGRGNININVNVHGQFSNNPRLAATSTATQVLRGISRSGSYSGVPLSA